MIVTISGSSLSLLLLITLPFDNGSQCFIYLFIYLFLAVLGLHCCSSCGERGLLLVAVRRLLTAVTSLVVEHGL